MLLYFLALALLFRFARASTRSRKSQIEPFASIIVAVYNGGASVLNCLDALSAQDYPRTKYEIIVVDDQSTDGTLERLVKFAEKQPILLLQNSQRGKYRSTKKSALELGISRARGDIMLFTDADCLPGKTWLKAMVEYFDEETALVAGFSPQTATNKVLRHLLTVDAAAAALVAAAAIAAGRGITCSGRNLAYRKDAFTAVGGFARTPDSVSGDDDFVLQAISMRRRWKIRYAFDKSTMVLSAGPQNVKSFLQQKRRHISAGKYFPRTAQAGFALFSLINALIWLSAFSGLFIAPALVLPLLLKFGLDYAILRWFLHHFTIKVRWSNFLLWELLYFYYNSISGPVGLLKKERW
ncbi:glycosyltransferase [candidate division KSB1 bacterium]|nr:glycosyltransferase [candidate division KSB1 bacterium]